MDNLNFHQKNIFFLLPLTYQEGRINGATTFSIMTFSIMTLSIMTLSIMTLSTMTLNIMTLSIMDLIVTLSTIDTQHNDTLRKH
jgi:hypothetical protein